MSLENVQPGDTLIWHGNYGRSKRIVVVKRITKTQIVVGLSKFRKSDGKLVGVKGWAATNVTIPKPGEIEEVHYLHLQSKLISQINDGCQLNLLQKMSLGKLEELNRVLESNDAN
jgi:hypothetical protein